MELNLILSDEIVFRGASSVLYDRESKKMKVKSISKRDVFSYDLTLYPVIDERSTASYQTVCTTFRENSIDLLFGDTDLAKKLKIRSPTWTNGTTNLTLSSSNDGRLIIVTEGGTPKDDEDDYDYVNVDIFEGLLNLQESLPPNSIEFILSVRNFHDFFLSDNSDYDSEEAVVERGMDFNEKGLKFKRNEVGSACLEMADIHFPREIWWKRWSYNWSRFSGYISINVRLDTVAVTELYKRNFRGGPSSATGTAFDMVILVGGNEDKEKGIKCHQAILSAMSPVLAAMFQADMLEAKEGIWEIVDFSEACIRALIEFTYRRNVEEALKSSEMALELLEVADKYEMKELKYMLLQIIWFMPFTWFSVDMLIKLVFYAKNAGEDLAGAEKKGWKALKWYANSYPEKVMESKEYASLCENPGVIMELGLAVLKNIDSDRAINW